MLRSIEDDNFARELFEAYIDQLKGKLKEKDRKREEEKVAILFPFTILSTKICFQLICLSLLICLRYLFIIQ